MPLAVPALVITGSRGLNVNVADPIPPSFVALIVADVVPEAVGVPETIPVVVSTESPSGRPVAL